MRTKNNKVIFDTNVWISYLIGKHLSDLSKSLSSGEITIITTSQLLTEIEVVTQRKKFKKYFPKEKVNELINLLKTIGEVVKIKPKYFISRDAKDNFLLDLIHFGKADYLVTGDKDLLELKTFKNSQNPNSKRI